MVFSPKTKGFFIEQTDHGWLMARTSAGSTPLVIEALREVSAAELDAVDEVVTQIAGRKTPSGYLQANCAVYPKSRVVRRATLEPRRAKDTTYLAEVCSTQFRIESDKFALVVLQAADGAEFDGQKPGVKEALFCGALHEEIDGIQDRLLERSVYPDRLEVGTLGTLGALVDYLAFRQVKAPTLVLELGGDTTQSFIVTAGGVEVARPIPLGLDSMVPLVQKELGLKDEEAARRLFHSNTFDFTGLGPQLTRRLVKELQSSIGFYEVQTGQSIGQIVCTQLPPKLEWLQAAFAQALGVPPLTLDLADWLTARQITFVAGAAPAVLTPRWLGLIGLMLTHHALPPEEKK